MIKTMFKRMINSYCYAVAITATVYIFVYMIKGDIPMLQQYRERFNNEAGALLVQLMLIGIMSAVLAGGTIIMEMEKLSLVLQSVLYFLVSSPAWISVACICWGFGSYIHSTVTTTISYIISYSICWIIQYRLCKKNVEDINKELKRMGQS